MLIPKGLKEGDKIGVISTARKISKEEIQYSLEIFKSWGLRPILGKHLFKNNYQFAGSDKERAFDLQEMLAKKEIKAIIFARGGYGTIRIIDQINFSVLSKKPKWFVGYSDITMLHSFLNKKKIASIHSTMPINFPNNTKAALKSLKEALFKRETTYNITSSSFNKKGRGKGELIGGNLSILYSLLGSNTDTETKGKILFLEDVDEYLYHIERMIISLKRAGKLKSLTGLIIGKMTDLHDNKDKFGKKIEEIILDVVAEYKYPVCFNFPAGHINNNTALIFGKKVSLDVKKKQVRLTYLA